MSKKARILLVEDDLALAAAYKLRMEAEGFDVRHCPDGEEAMQEALEFHPDLILLDIMMPKISGFDVLDILRNTKETAHTKIIILTALSQPSDRQRAKDLGADEFLVKSQAVIADVMKRIRFHLGIKEPEPA
jgi:DNA-binding response OmpR family regulator